MAENDLVTLQFTLGTYIGREFDIWSGNRELLDSCSVVSHDVHLHPDFAPTVIIKELWQCLRESHKLRVVVEPIRDGKMNKNKAKFSIFLSVCNKSDE